MEMETVKRASVKTELRLGFASAEVGLYKTKAGDPKSRPWDKAGPNGHPLRMEAKPVEAAPDEGNADALGVTPVREEPPPTDPGPEAETPPVDEPPARSSGGESVPATTKNVLVEEETGEEVEPDEVRRGLRLDDGSFTDLTDLLETVEEESRAEGVEVLGFIRRERVPRERVVDSYFLGAENASGARLVRVLFEAMKETGRVAVVRWTKRKGQSLGILTPRGDGAMVVLELAFAEVCRAPNAKCLAHLQAEVSRGIVEQAQTLIESMEWSPDRLDEVRNRRIELEQELIDRAEAGRIKGHKVEPEKKDAEIADLGDVLARSIAA
jgi:Ku protein